MIAPDDDNSVGYGRPPKHSRFKKGQSGNPKGRPKGSRNFANILEEELDQKVSVTDGGKRRRVSKRRLAIRQQVNKAAQGDPKAFQAIARLHREMEEGTAGPSGHDGGARLPPSELSDEQLEEVFAAFIAKQKRGGDT